LAYFQTKNPYLFGSILEGIAMEDVGISISGHFGLFLWPFGIFYGRLEYFVAIWYILWPFGIFCSYLVYLSPSGVLYQEKSGNPDVGRYLEVLNLISIYELATKYHQIFCHIPTYIQKWRLF
jgi:hypothetical protein